MAGILSDTSCKSAASTFAAPGALVEFEPPLVGVLPTGGDW
jgi:hypothetical protein